MAITQLVDERIEFLRRERAELDALRTSLEKQQAELDKKQQEQDNLIGPLIDRKEALLREIEDSTVRAEALRAERNASIETFGVEMDGIFAEKNADGIAHAKELQLKIASLSKTKLELEESLQNLREEVGGLEEKSDRDMTRIIEEKESLLNRTRAENEANIKDMNLAHSIAQAELSRQKKELENEIAALEQTKEIEWSKIQAEVSRYKTTQFAETDALKGEIVGEAEAERARILGDLRTEEKRLQTELAQSRREWERELLELEGRKKQLTDETKLLEFEYEKAKSEIQIKHEKDLVDAAKELETVKAEGYAKVEEERALATFEWKRQAAEEKSRHIDDIAALDVAVQELTGKRDAVLKDIDSLQARFDQRRAEDDAELALLKTERMCEIDEHRLDRLKEIEDLRQTRVAELETYYIERVRNLDAAKEEKLFAARQIMDSAEKEAQALRQQRNSLEMELSKLRTERDKITEENSALDKKAFMERQLELEKYTAEKMFEAEKVIALKMVEGEERAKRLHEDNRELEERLTNEIASVRAGLLDLKHEKATIEAELNLQKELRLTELKKETIVAQDELSKLKLAKYKEIEAELESYKEVRFDSVKKDIERMTTTSHKQFDELVELNREYNTRMLALQELALQVESDKRNINVMEQQIALLQEQLNNYTDVEAENHKLSLRLVELERALQV